MGLTAAADKCRPAMLISGIFSRNQGFPERILKRAFEPYVTTKAKGTGLGLAVVKKSRTNTAPVLTSPTDCWTVR